MYLLGLFTPFLALFLDKLGIITPHHGIYSREVHPLNRLLLCILYKDILSPSCFIEIIWVVRGDLSPNGYPAPLINSTPKEQATICNQVMVRIQQATLAQCQSSGTV